MTKKRLYLSPPDIGNNEINYIQDALSKNWVSTVGENINAFEATLCKITTSKFCTAVNSGTSALHLALILAGVKKGDEVICSSFTFVASANPILYLEATPVFVDSEADTWNMSPELLEEAIIDRLKKGKKPKAILLVHLYGQPAKLTELLKIANQYEINLIEDAAESLGSTYHGQMTGTFGLMGIYSFNGNKIITTSAGGALISNNPSLTEKAKFLSTQARDQAIHYQHSETGYNYRMSNILAGIGLGQLDVLDERINKKRLLFDYYKKRLEPSGSFNFPVEQENTFCNRWLSVLTSSASKPELLHKKLEENNIESRPLWKPLHLQPLFKGAPAYLDGTSELLFQKGLCLPSGTKMNEEDLELVIDILIKK